MNRRIIPFIIVIATICACEKLSTKDSSENIKAIDKAKTEAVDAIQKAKTTAIDSANAEITAKVAQVVQNANAALSSAIDNAKNEIQESVQTSVDKKVNERLQETTKEIAEAKRLAGIVGVIAIVAMLLCAYLIVKILRINRITEDNDKNFTDKVVNVVINSDRIRTYIAQRTNVSKSSVSTINSNGHDFEEAVYRCVTSGMVKGFLDLKYGKVSVQTNYNTPVNHHSATLVSDKESAHVENVQEPKFELFARDSETTTLNGIQSSFQKGKSIYKLVLINKDDRYADITLCLEQEGVQRRILSSNIEMLTPICSVEHKSPEPQKVIVEKVGKAEMIEQDSWKVTTPISVVLE